MNYNPNLVSGGRMAQQNVTLRFQQWQYTCELCVTVGGNTTGFDVIECAVSIAHDRISKDGGQLARLRMRRPNGDTLVCEDEMDQGEDWLKSMLVGARITSIRKST